MATENEPTLRADPDDRELVRREHPARAYPAIAALLVLAAAILGWLWWSGRLSGPEPPLATAPAPAASAPAAEAAPAVKYPLPPSEADTQPLEAAGIVPALTQLLGRNAVDTLLQTGDFPRRLVATVDNLGREHAPAAMWPVAPTPGRFAVEQRGDTTVIAAGNAARYAPLVLLAEQVDAKDAVALYRRMYPLLQQAYRDLGFGQRYLNDRVVEVIDLLLATPEPAEPPRLQLMEVKGPIPSQRPWVRYEYQDPALERLSSGQKILVRVGLANERKLKHKLAELRAQLVQPQPPAAAAR